MRSILILISLSIVLFLFACSRPVPEASTLSETGAKEKALPARVSELQGWEKEWNDALAMAKKEGKLVIIGNWSAEQRLGMSEAVKEKLNLSLDVVIGRGGELGARILKERQAGLHLLDFYMGGSTTVLSTLKPAGMAASFEPLLILPEVKEPKAWYDGQLPWLDKDRLVLVFGLQVSGTDDILINTQQVGSEEIKVFKDLLHPKWKGKIVMDDPTIEGKGLQLFSIFAKKYGYDYWRKLAQQEPVLLRDKRQEVEFIARGKYLVAIGARPEFISEFQRLGTPIRTIISAEVAYLTGPRSATLFMDKAPHPWASKVFLNWLLTREGQTAWTKATSYQSAREDVTTEYVPADSKRKPGVKYFLAEGEEFLLDKPNQLKLSQEIFGHLLK